MQVRDIPFNFKKFDLNIYSVCRTTNDNEPSCDRLTFPQTSFTYITASLVDDKIFIRAVTNNKTAYIYVFEPTLTAKYELVKSAADNTFMSEFTAVASFSTLTHTYFVGSATRKDLPLKTSNSIDSNAEPRHNHEVRITRVCNNDNSKDLDSRIDLVLSCSNVDYSNVDEDVRNVATAASYFPDSGRLLISMKGGNKNSTICEYNFKQIQERFENTWSFCQSATTALEKTNVSNN